LLGNASGRRKDFMRLSLHFAASIALAVSAASIPSFAQMQDNTEKQLSCNNGGNDNNRARHCEMREQNYPTIGRLDVAEVRNGAISVKGALRGDVLVRARVESYGDTESAAAMIGSQVSIDGSGGQVRANGPQSGENSSWNISYEIFVPQTTDLTLKAGNGAISISDVRGTMHFEVNNGAVRLKRVAGDVSGSTTNGAIQADLSGGMWDGRQFEVTTHNGAVTLTMPQYYNAHVQAETGNGRIQSDFVMPIAANAANTPSHNMDFNLGAGGPLIHITTGNGAVRLKRAEQ
jgi:hypothetical protein